MASARLPPPSPPPTLALELSPESDNESADTASQESVSLSSAPPSNRNSFANSDPRQSFATQSSESYTMNRDSIMSRHIALSEGGRLSTPSRRASEMNEAILPPATRLSASMPVESKPTTYPPKPPPDDAMSISSFASTSSRKARPESLLIQPTIDPLILGIALVDFNHLVHRFSSFLLPFCIFDRQVC